jgi:phosphotransacetylase
MITIDKKITQLNELERIATTLSPKTLIIPGGDRSEDISVVKYFSEKNYISRIILVGNISKMYIAAEKIGVLLNPEDLIEADSDEDKASKTVGIIKKGDADIILKGGISTPVLNREILKIKVQDTISLVTLFQTDCIGEGKLFLLTDPGVTTVCDFDRMKSLILNASEVARKVLGIEVPRAALLSANEKVIPSLPSTVLAEKLTNQDWTGLKVYGPLSFDLAVDLESARIKGILSKKNNLISEVAGQADILVCPGLDSANILYKVIMSMAGKGQAEMAGITMGVQVPYIILSRSEPESSKINSIALCCIMAEQSK